MVEWASEVVAAGICLRNADGVTAERELVLTHREAV